MIAPHGGQLINRMASEEEKQDWLARIKELKKLPVAYYDLSEMENIATGLFSPLEGFMNQEDYDGVLETMRLKNGLAFSVPIVLSIGKDKTRSIRKGDNLLITDTKLGKKPFSIL